LASEQQYCKYSYLLHKPKLTKNTLNHEKTINKKKINYSYIYLLIGFIFLFFFNDRWILPIAAFIAPVFLIRFLRYQKPLIGFLIIVLAGW
jgi:hypothetical protein